MSAPASLIVKREPGSSKSGRT